MTILTLRRRAWSLMALAVAILLPNTAAATGLPAPPLPPFTLPARDHPLPGRVWSPSEQRFVSAEEFAGRLAAAERVLVGEKHDNPDHHRLQAWVVALAGSRRQGGAVAFEMIPTDLAPALAQFLAQPAPDPGALGEALTWEQRGWPRWTTYRPIADAALDAGMALTAAGPPRSLEREVGNQGLDALSPAERRRLALSPLPQPLQAGLEQEIFESHCGLLPRARLPRIAAVQQLRDAWMADALMGAARPAVMIAGLGHTRPDRGIPWYLRQQAAPGTLLSVALVEAEPEKTDPAAYGDFGGSDYLIFTPKAEREEDPCRRMRQTPRRPR